MAKNKRIIALWRNIDTATEQAVIRDVGNTFTYGMTNKEVLKWMADHKTTHVDWQDDGCGENMPGGLKCGIHTIGEIAAFLNVRRVRSGGRK